MSPGFAKRERCGERLHARIHAYRSQGVRSPVGKQSSRILEAIGRLAEVPRPHTSKKLVGLDFYRIRVGDYRVIYAINDKTLTVTVVRVRHRKDAY